jgi:hypothetical protein
MDTDRKEKGSEQGKRSSDCSSGTSALIGEHKKLVTTMAPFYPNVLFIGKVESSPISDDEPTAPGEEPPQREARRRRNRRRNIRRHHAAGEHDPAQPVS